MRHSQCALLPSTRPGTHFTDGWAGGTFLKVFLLSWDSIQFPLGYEPRLHQLNHQGTHTLRHCLSLNQLGLRNEHFRSYCFLRSDVFSLIQLTVCVILSFTQRRTKLGKEICWGVPGILPWAHVFFLILVIKRFCNFWDITSVFCSVALWQCMSHARKILIVLAFHTFQQNRLRAVTLVAISSGQLCHTSLLCKKMRASHHLCSLHKMVLQNCHKIASTAQFRNFYSLKDAYKVRRTSVECYGYGFLIAARPRCDGYRSSWKLGVLGHDELEKALWAWVSTFTFAAHRVCVH